MPRKLSPSTDRDLALMLLLVLGLLALCGLAGLLMLGAAVSTALLGGPFSMPSPSRWTAGVFGVLADPAHPGDGLGAPWAPVLAGHGAAYWMITTVVLAVTLLGVLAVDVPIRRRFGPVEAGHASRADIHVELSPHAAARTAAWTRPSIPAADRSRVPLGEIAVPLHTGPHRETLCVPLENPTGTLAPTQTGKTRRDLIHKTLAAPGAALVSTTKPDLLELSALARAHREQVGPVLVFDVTGTVAWPAHVHWPPQQGCADPDVAYRRADTMVEAASVTLRDVGGNDKVFRDRAKFVVQSYLLAAALHHRDVEAMVRWATSKPPDQEPVTLLQRSGYADYARNLRAEIGMVAETSDAVWLSVRRVLEPFLNHRLRHLCTPPAGREFDARAFLAQHGSLYLVASQQMAAQAAPVLTALVEHWLTTAQEMALHTPQRRLDPPASAILDELTTATPVPQLPDIAADSAGRGVLIHWAAQSLAALEHTYGAQRCRQLLDNTSTLSIWGGIKDARTLDWASTLTGHHERRRHQHQSAGPFGPGRTSTGLETVPTYRPGDIRRIGRSRVLLIHRHLDPIRARSVDVSQRSDWATLKQHQKHVRDGTVALTPDGFTTPAARGTPPASWPLGNRRHQ